MNKTTIKVLLADDNKDFCDIIVAHLNKQENINVVAVAMDGIDAMNKIRDTHPDVAIIDGIMRSSELGREVEITIPEI